MGDTGVKQTAGQRSGPGAVRHRRPGPPASYLTSAGRGKPQHPDRGTADQYRSPGQQPGARIGAQAQPGGSQLVFRPWTQPGGSQFLFRPWTQACRSGGNRHADSPA